MPTSMDVFPAAAQAARLLHVDSDRWRHVVGVGWQAESIAGALPEEERELLVSAAWLHDIGYARAVQDTGLHSLDGARYLRSIGASSRLCRLVAHHTASIVEAEFRGLAEVLEEEFPIEHSDVADALTYVDMTTGPQGQPMTVQERLREILERYPREHVVHQSILQARPAIIRVVTLVQRRLETREPLGNRKYALRDPRPARRLRGDEAIRCGDVLRPLLSRGSRSRWGSQDRTSDPSEWA